MAADRFPIEAGHVLLFARSVGDPNPVYADEDTAVSAGLGGIPAPPTFLQASAQFDPDYPLRPRIGQPWFGSGREPSGLMRRRGGGAGSAGASGPEARSGPSGGGGGGLHAEQHFEYHAPVRVGDVLSAATRRGDTWEKQGRRAGKLVFSEAITEYRNQHGELVVTARSVAVRTERPADTSGDESKEA